MTIATAIGLGSHARCAHAQEAEVPINEVKHHRTHRHCRNEAGIAQVPGNAHIEQAQQRNCDIGHNRGQGNLQYVVAHRA